MDSNGAWTWCGKDFGELREERDFGLGGELAYVGDTEKEKKKQGQRILRSFAVH